MQMNMGIFLFKLSPCRLGGDGYWCVRQGKFRCPPLFIQKILSPPCQFSMITIQTTHATHAHSLTLFHWYINTINLGLAEPAKGSANLKMIVVFFQSSNVIASTMERPLLLCFNVKIEVLSPSRQNIALSFKKFALVSLNNKQTSSHFYFPRQSWENAMRLDRIISI